MNFRHPGRLPVDDDRPDIGRAKSIMVDLYPITRDIRSVIPIRSAVHVKAVAVGVFKDEIVSRLVTRSRLSGPGNRVAAPVEQVGFNKRD